jgi:c-di-GMP-binding flagellar brake protein YcgR
MQLTIGTIVIIDQDFTKQGEKFKSKVIDVGDDYFMIDYPTQIDTGRTAFFMDGTQLHVTFVDDNKISHAFKAEVRGRLQKKVPMLKLSYPGDDHLIKIQRREFVRVDTNVDVSILKDNLYSQFIGLDLSAGGIALSLPNQTVFEEDEILELLIVLPFLNNEIKYINVKASVIRIWEKSGKYIASLRFEDIQNENRQRIIRFCFERQLLLRRTIEK